VQSPTVLNGAEVSIEPVAHIAPDGSPTADQRYRRDLPDETLCWIYEMMVVTRGVDTELVNLQRQGELALYPSCRGQEAAQIGAVGALRKTDWLFPQYRELGAFLLRNIAPSNVAAAWRGTWHGGLEFTDKHCAPMSVPIGTQVLHAVGSAMASAKLGDDNVSVGFLGDGATSTGDVHEAMNFASVFRAPCIFYVQNNQWAISVPVSKQLAAPSIAHRAIGYGMPGVRVDGNDPLACYAVMAFAAERARAGEGPTLIEAVTYRLAPHTTSDDPKRYRSEDEVAQWQALDPVPRYRNYLRHLGLWSDKLEDRADARAARLRTELRDNTVARPDASLIEVFDATYSDPPADLIRQRDQLFAELQKEKS